MTEHEQFNPKENPAGRKLILKQEFSKQIDHYFRTTKKEGIMPHVLLLLCPAYPHDGVRFTYQRGQEMTGDIPPTIGKFVKKIDILLHCLYRQNLLQNLTLQALVCEIESDLPRVVDTFARSSKEQFKQNVLESAAKTETYLQQRYPYLEVQGSTFYGTFHYLEDHQQRIRDEIKSGNIILPNTFIQQLDQVVDERGNSMFRDLYGAETREEQYNLAVRQMINYLAVTAAAAQQYPRGCLIINAATPNYAYVSQSDEVMRGVLGIPDEVQVPDYQFI